MFAVRAGSDRGGRFSGGVFGFAVLDGGGQGGGEGVVLSWAGFAAWGCRMVAVRAGGDRGGTVSGRVFDLAAVMVAVRAGGDEKLS